MNETRETTGVDRTEGYQDLAEGTPQTDEVRAGDEGGGETTSAEATVDPTLERRAREIGWRPREEWRGPSEKWKNAEAYVAFHDSVLLPQKLWQENKDLRLTQEQMKAELAELRKERQEEAKRREELKRQSLEYERKAAAENGDHARVAEITDELVDLKVTQKLAAVPQTKVQLPDAETNRIWEGFVSDNPAFLSPDMQEVLTEQMTLMRQSGNTRVGREFLDRAKERVTRMYPEIFVQNKRRAPMADMGGTPGNAGASGKTWGDLRPDVREAYEGMLTEDPYLARDQKKLEAAKARILAGCTAEHFRR